MKNMNTNNSIGSIVILKAVQLGDMICSIPAFRALRHTYPNANITLIGLPWSKDFVNRFYPYIDNWIEFPGYPGLPESHPDIHKIPEFLNRIQKENYDIAVQMQEDGTIVNPLVMLFNANHSFGFYKRGGYNPDRHTFLPYPENVHEIKRNLMLVKLLGADSKNEELELPIYDKEYKEFDLLKHRFNLDRKKYICIHPGARDAKKRWNTENFAYIADYFADKGFNIVITGSKSEENTCREVKNNMRYSALNLSGATSLGMLTLIIQYSSLLIANDTGVSHVASTVNIPNIIILSPYSDLEKYSTVNNYLHKIVKHNESNVDKVIQTAVEILTNPDMQKFRSKEINTSRLMKL